MGALDSTGLAIVSAVIAAAAAGVAFWRSVLAGRQAREARKARELSAVISLFNAHQSEEASRVRHLIRHGAIGDRLDDPDIRFQLRNYINQLNFIATLRARRLLGDELVRDLFYESAKTCWDHCAKSFVRETGPPRTTTSPGSCRPGSTLPTPEPLGGERSGRGAGPAAAGPGGR